MLSMSIDEVLNAGHPSYSTLLCYAHFVFSLEVDEGTKINVNNFILDSGNSITLLVVKPVQLNKYTLSRVYLCTVL